MAQNQAKIAKIRYAHFYWRSTLGMFIIVSFNHFGPKSNQ